MEAWIQYDKEQAGTPYWNHITQPELQFEARLVALLKTYNILRTGKEFIMTCADSVRLIDEFQGMGIAVDIVGIFCFVPEGQSSDDCCAGYGGPGVKGGWFQDCVLMGYSAPEFPRDLDYAAKCNPLARAYITDQLPKEREYSERIHVDPSPYVPLMWNLFPDTEEA
jgi:hypothetical protein